MQGNICLYIKAFLSIHCDVARITSFLYIGHSAPK